MKTIIKYISRFIISTLLIAMVSVCVCIGVFWYCINNSQSWMTTACKEALNEKFPGWPIELEKAVLDGDGVIRICKMVLLSPKYHDSIVEIPELKIEVDHDLFIKKQKIKITQLYIENPIVNIKQRPDLSWNTSELILPDQKEKQQFAGLKLKNGTLYLSLNPHGNSPARLKPIPIAFEKIQAELVSPEDERFVLRGESNIATLGKVLFKTEFHKLTGAWNFDLELQECKAGNDLINTLVSLAPDINQSISKLDAKNFHSSKSNLFTQLKSRPPNLAQNKLKRSADPLNISNNPIQTVSQSQLQLQLEELSPPVENTKNAVIPDARINQKIDLGTELFLTAHIQASSLGYTYKPKWNANVEILDGRISHPAFPFPLYQIKGEIEADERQVKTKTIEATNGLTSINLNGLLHHQYPESNDGWYFTFENLLCDERLIRVLPSQMQELQRELNLSGTMDIQVKLLMTPQKKFDYFLTSVKLKNCLSQLRKFPYPITNIYGTIWQQAKEQDARLLLFKLTGMAGQQKVTMRGGVVNPGPGYESVINAHVKGLPLDATFRQALPPPVKKTVEEMKLTGVANFYAQLVRPPRDGEKFKLQVSGELKKGTMNWEVFPYHLEDLTGTFVFSNDVWSFSDMKAKHGNTLLTGEGTFSPKDPEEWIDLDIKAVNGTFDHLLENALVKCEPMMKDVWKQINPAGEFDLELNVNRKPSKPIGIKFKRLQTKNASFVLKSFPYRFTNVNAVATGVPGDMTFEKFSAKHEQAQFRGKGTLKKTKEYWHLKVFDTHFDDITPDHAFKAALPKVLQDTMDGISLKDRFSLSGGFQVAGSLTDPDLLVGEWDLEAILSGADLVAGIDVEDIYGTVSSKGTIDEKGYTQCKGKFKFDTMKVLGYHLLKVSGPWEIKGTELVFGSRKMFEKVKQGKEIKPPLPQERITGLLFNGVATLDAISLLNEESPYRVRLTINDGKLQDWAKVSGYGTSRIRGDINGWLDLQGDKNWQQSQVGRGRVWVKEAELYELPILIRIFRAIQFVPPDKTAFRYAFTDFHMNGKQFLFDHIDLIGEAISLVGNGYVNYDGRVALDFDSIVPRSQLPIPIVNNLINSKLIRGASRGIFKVKVRGTLTVPEVLVNAGVPLVDDALSGLLKTVERGANEVMPLLVPPPTFSNPGNTTDARLRPGRPNTNWPKR